MSDQNQAGDIRMKLRSVPLPIRGGKHRTSYNDKPHMLTPSPKGAVTGAFLTCGFCDGQFMLLVQDGEAVMGGYFCPFCGQHEVVEIFGA